MSNLIFVLFLTLFLFISACTTIEKHAGCDLPPLPEKAFLWWGIEGEGLTVMSAVPREMRGSLEVERNEKGEVTALYLDEKSRRVIEAYAACQAMG